MNVELPRGIEENLFVISNPLSDEKMSFLGATLGNLHIPSIGGIKKQISKVLWTFIKNSRVNCKEKPWRRDKSKLGWGTY